ncbi:MAG: alpha/beta hydrolase, partial [Kiritimatiellae bacterium]|nr:alpha/beta hydrolase [Kiritimatiellia bacterium]
WTHYSAMGTAQAACPAKATVALKKGANAVALVAPPNARAEITLFARDNRRPALTAKLSPSARKTMRYEGVMPFEYAPAKGLLPPAVLPVRPGETARLEIEVMGPAKNPTFSFPAPAGSAKNTFTFPVVLAADEKLVCIDGVNWKVEKIANGVEVAKGRLPAVMPLLTRSVPLEFTAELVEGKACEVDLLKHYQATPAQRKAASDDNFTILRDVPYYPAESYTNDYMQTFCKMHLRVPKNTNGFATVVWFHGGGLIHGSRGSFYHTPQDDVASVSAGYRLLTNATPTECLSDAGAVVAWTLKHIAEYGGDPKKVFLSGSSGGGYLSLMVGMDPKWLAPHGFKPTDLAGLLPQTGQASTHFTIRSVNGDKTSTYITKVDEWAPLSYAARDLPPMLIQTGEPEIDIPCRAEENKLLYASLKALGHADLEHHAYAGRRHGTMSQDVKPFESDFIHRRIRQIDGVPFSTGDNPVRTCLERAVAEGLATDIVSLVSDCAYAHDEVCVQRKGNRSDLSGDGAWLVPLLERVARASLQADGESLPAPGTPLKQINRKIPWVKDTYVSALFTRVIDPLGMKDTKLVASKKGEEPRWVTTAEDALRVAELIARKGEWHGRRLFPATAALPLPFAFEKCLFAEANGEAGVLFTARNVSDLPAFEKLATAWRALVTEKNR